MPRSPAPLALFLAVLLAACGSEPDAPPTDGVDAAGPLVVYAGRSPSLVDSLVAQLERDTGADVEVRYGETPQLAAQLAEEGARSPADVFWAQDAGALGAASDLLAPLSDDLLDLVPEGFRGTGGRWVAVSGRARTLAYAPDRVDAADLPESVLDLTDPAWRGRVGWAPQNASFQSFVTALRAAVGEDAAREWLVAMRENGAQAYPKNSAIIEAIAAGEVDLGLPNHYYLLRFKEQEGPGYPVEQTTFAAGDVGNLINVAGVGILATSSRPQAAQRFVEYLLSDAAQRYFVEETHEYAVTGAGVSAERRAAAPDLPLDRLAGLDSTLVLLREAEVL